MKVKCKVCGEWFEKEDRYCDHCSAKYGSEKSAYDMDLFNEERFHRNGEISTTPNNKQTQEQKQVKVSTQKKTASTKAPDLDTLRDLKNNRSQKANNQEKMKLPSNILKGVIFLIVLINLFANLMDDQDDYYFDDDTSFEETSVEETSSFDEVKKEFPMNSERNFTGEVTPIPTTAEGIYEGVLSTATYLNFDSKNMRFDLKDEDYSAIYKTPIYISITKIVESNEYYMDVWDKNTLKILGTYILPQGSFDDLSGIVTGEPHQNFYDDPSTVDFDGLYSGTSLSGRLALPYTIENEINYFDFSVEKINDDTSEITAFSYFENETVETFISNDGTTRIDFYTYVQDQGYPHSSMYYDGVFVFVDGENTYPPMPFYMSDDGELYAYMEILDSEALTIRDADFNEYMYYDELDTQLYRYHPVKDESLLYRIEFIGQIYADSDDTKVDGSFYVTNDSRGYDDYRKDFTIIYTESE